MIDLGLDHIFGGHDSFFHDHAHDAGHDHHENGLEHGGENDGAVEGALEADAEIIETAQMARLVGAGGAAVGMSRMGRLLPGLAQIGAGSTRIMGSVSAAVVGASAVSRVVEQRNRDTTRGNIPPPPQHCKPKVKIDPF